MKLVELFHSFQGEATHTGRPMTFIRITGCPVACPFCDTPYEQGTSWEIADIIKQVKHRAVCITGGEPLVHPQFTDLVKALLDKPLLHRIHIETSGCYPLPPIIYQFRSIFWITVSPKGTFLGAKKNFLPQVLEDADEVKWLWPATPEDLILDNLTRCSVNYIQPVNEEKGINYDNLRDAATFAAEHDLPISLQVHKLFQWR